MPLITKSLRMNGHAIQTPREFREFFSPGDFLRNKELAAYFAIRQMEQVSPAHTYFSQLLDIAVIQTEAFCSSCRRPPEVCIRNPKYTENAKESCPLAEALQNAKSFSISYAGHWGADAKAGTTGWDYQKNNALMTSLEQHPFRLKIRQQVQQIVGQTGLSGLQKFRLDLILSMGYLLAGWLPEERPISSAEAEAAFLGKAWVPAITFRDTPEGRVYPARPEPYTLQLRKGTALAPGETITLRKLIAGPSAEGNATMPVVFRLPDRLEQVMPGDYRYASFVGDEMIRLYPVEKKNGDRILQRQGNTLYLKNSQGTVLKNFSCAGQNIVDMAPAPKKEEWILLTPDRVDYRKFHDKTLPSRRIVELQMKDNFVYLLTELGEVRRHGDRMDISRRTTMDGLTL